MGQTEQNINLTGNRVLFILSLLLKGDISKDEIIKEINLNPELKPVSQDTIRLDINTLRDAGFKIENSGKNYKYRITWNPVKIKLQKSEINLLNKIKKSALELWDWKSVLDLYKFFKKIGNYIEDEKSKESLLNFRNFMHVDFKLLVELDYHCQNRNEIIIDYNSPKGEIIQIHLKCLEINLNHDTQKLHLYCKFPGYEDISYLRLDKILRIIKVVKEKTISDPVINTCFYKLKKTGLKNFNLNENEKIISDDNDFLTIEVKMKNKFHLIQRLMTLGEDAVCDNKEIKEEILSNLLKTKEIYK